MPGRNAMEIKEAIKIIDIMAVVRNYSLSELEYEAIKTISEYFENEKERWIED